MLDAKITTIFFRLPWSEDEFPVQDGFPSTNMNSANDICRKGHLTRMLNAVNGLNPGVISWVSEV